jgi:hypothetical protein
MTIVNDIFEGMQKQCIVAYFKVFFLTDKQECCVD